MTQPFSLYDRRAFAAEMFFTDRTAFFPGREGWSVAEMKEYICSAPFAARFALVRDIRRAVRELYAKCPDPEGIMPGTFAPLGSALTLPLMRSELLSEYIDWLESVRRYTDDTRAGLDMSMLDVLSRLDGTTADFLSGVRRLASLRAMVYFEGDCLVAGFAEREWGKAVLRFPQARLSGSLTLPMPCYLFSVQGALEQDRCRFSILCDTEFSQEDYALRMLRNEHWHELSFESDLPVLELKLYDYPRAMQLSGASGLELIERCSAALVSKETVCSAAVLTSAERSLLCCARLFDGLARSVDLKRRDSLERCRSQILSALDDRYSCSVIAKRLEPVLGGKVSATLNDACEQMMLGEHDNAMRTALTFYRLLRECRARCMAHDCLCSIADDFLTAAEYDTPGTVQAAAQYVRAAAEPELGRLGFAGEYPHYSRVVGAERQYISLLLNPESDRPFRGVYGFELSIACARTLDSRVSELARPDDVCARECAAYRPPLSDYTELCSAADDGETLPVSVSYLGDCDVRFDPEPLCSRLTLASRVMRGSPMPKQYAAQRHRTRGFWASLLRAVESSAYLLPLVCVLLLGVYLAARKNVELVSRLEPVYAVLLALGVSLAVFVLGCAAAYFKGRRLFWRQR